jgi:hypothetical protein
MHVPFFLDDNTGMVMVDPRGADLDLHCDFQQEFCDSLFTFKEEAPPNVHSFLARHGINTTNKIKVEEFCIKPKNSLFLLGTLDDNPGIELTPKPIQDPETLGFSTKSLLPLAFSGTLPSLTMEPDPSLEQIPMGETRVGGRTLREAGFDKSDLYRTGMPKTAHATVGQVIQLSPTPAPAKAADMTQQQKVAAALTKAGISNPAAWAAAGVTAAVVDGSLQAAPAPSLDGYEQRPPVVLLKGRNNPTFLISWRSQRDLARSLGWKCTLMIWGGPALFLFSLYGLHLVTHWF